MSGSITLLRLAIIAIPLAFGPVAATGGVDAIRTDGSARLRHDR